jgi:hypothetical protein
LRALPGGGGGGGGTGRLFLHARELAVAAPGGKAWRVVAPPPAPWPELLAAQGWEMPDEEYV